MILSHLVTKDLPEPSITRKVRYRRIPDDLAPYLKTWDPSFKDWGESAVDPKDGFYRLTRYDNDERGSVIKPALPTFKGRVWVLVGAANSSATFEFAQDIQRNRLGKLVGQPTGRNHGDGGRQGPQPLRRVVSRSIDNSLQSHLESDH